MRKFSILILFSFVFAACTQSPEKRLSGTWVISEIKADSSYYDHFPAELIEKAFALKKRTYINLYPDHRLEYVSPGAVHEGKWRMGADEYSIITGFEGAGKTDSLAFSFLSDSCMVIVDHTRFGTIRTVYVKDGGDAISF